MKYGRPTGALGAAFAAGRTSTGLSGVTLSAAGLGYVAVAVSAAPALAGALDRASVLTALASCVNVSWARAVESPVEIASAQTPTSNRRLLPLCRLLMMIPSF